MSDNVNNKKVQSDLSNTSEGHPTQSNSQTQSGKGHSLDSNKPVEQLQKEFTKQDAKHLEQTDHSKPEAETSHIE
ncbi:hypothetical protein RI367_000114 [Sorochytrium milnesiophthora]